MCLVGDRIGCSSDTYLDFLKFAGASSRLGLCVFYLAFYFSWGFFSCFVFSLLSAHKYNL